MFISIIPFADNIYIASKLEAKPYKNKVPYTNSKGRKNGVAKKIQTRNTCHKGYVGSNKRNHSAKTHSEASVFVKKDKGFINLFFHRGKSSTNGIDKLISKYISDSITNQSAKHSRN